MAKQKVDELMGRDAIVQAAQTRSEQILAQARVDAESIRREADDYIINALAALEGELNRLLGQARNGISKLNADRQRTLRSPEEMEPPTSS
jgi:hypothetical protein